MLQAKLARADTAGTALLALAPGGADVVVEVDLARLRGNEIVGSIYQPVAALLPERFAGLAGADVVVLAAYDVGGPGAGSLLLVRGGAAPDAATGIDADTAAMGPPALLERLDASRAGQGTTMADDEDFTRLRDAAMPERAKAATVRVTARLDFDARVSLASLWQVDAVPSSVSVWGDVVDDLAVVALLAGDDETAGRELADALGQWRSRVTRDDTARQWSLDRLADGVQVEQVGAIARAVLVVGPRALDRAVERLGRQLNPPPSMR